uniref:phosphoserine transaminase n=1 Tax=Chromera velia CCMP2878 TaxID=1169474 RepID=A0A0G4G470_9ALVE|eukprot:Cvel_20204.t1-p1 / transcript=Cvel_20204.t1 / gene=Cvel_20204 / organism=Chromera_velia_CCMP2878 / gene_product=Phosphoserine aminotransferase, putative / transcript_product=Phosphoserine aminotransferase, putative / location=Cvel_scaffold1797:29228-30217(+) / protein_length=330 / sequence_SO=supercontig / SO=protein_coding / is_pseudo=false
MSVMEMSHRSKEFIKIFDTTMADLKEILQIPQNYKLLMMQGGATLQFSCVPLNLLESQGAVCDYAVTGSWGQKAFEEGAKYGSAVKVCDTKPTKYTTIPPVDQWKLSPDAKYLHYCSNETIYGVEFKSTPVVQAPLVADMSSNFCSRPIDVDKHVLIYAGAQKNLGPAGATVVIVREDCIGKQLPITPTYLGYDIHAKNDSMYNTPPCQAVYMIGLMAKWMKQKGGLSAWQEYAESKAKILYDLINGSDGYYVCPVDEQYRSNMNVPFRVCCNEDMEKKFLEEAKKRKLTTLAGHRTVGGVRASIYNGMPTEGVQALADFMKEFQQTNPK